MKIKKATAISLSTETSIVLDALRSQGLPVDQSAVICALTSPTEGGREIVLFIQHFPETIDPVTRVKTREYTRRALGFFEAGVWQAGEVATGCRITRTETTEPLTRGHKLVETNGQTATHNGMPIYSLESLTRDTEKDVFLRRDSGGGSRINK